MELYVLKPGFHWGVVRRRSLSYSIGDDRRCSETVVGDGLRFDENQVARLDFVILPRGWILSLF